MSKPFINRVRELEWLDKAYYNAHTSGQLLILYGKRRVGKTELVLHFLNDKPSIYYLANKTIKDDQLQSVSSVFMTGLHDVYPAGFRFRSWRDFFDYILQKIDKRKKSDKPLILVFDEFPYLVEADKGISSFFQYGWDRGLKDARVLLIIMGSSISMMYAHTLAKNAPLYGRRTGQWLLEPFTYSQTKQFYPSKATFSKTFPLYALSGGIPAYARIFNGTKNLQDTVKEYILPEGSFLSVEPELLLSEEFSDPRSYLTILQAIGLGKTKFSEILQQSRLQATALPIYLKTLLDLRLIKKEASVTEAIPEKSKRGTYSVSDPFLRFYFSFIFPNKSLIQRQSYNALFKEHGQVLIYLLAKTYEDATADFIQMAIEKGKLPAFDTMGRYWDKSIEIDLVGLNKEKNRILFVETKWNTKPIDIDVLNHLENKAKQVRWGSQNRKEYFALLAKGGFTKQLVSEARKKHILLIQEDRIVGFRDGS